MKNTPQVDSDYAKLPEWDWSSLIPHLARADQRVTPTSYQSHAEQLKAILREFSTRAKGLRAWLYIVESLDVGSHALESRLLEGDEDGSPQDLVWAYNAAEVGAVCLLELGDGSLLAGLRVLLPSRSDDSLSLDAYLVIIRSEHGFVLRNTDLRALEGHLDLLASAIRSAVISGCHQEYTRARASLSIPAIRRSAALSLLAYSLSRFAVDRDRAFSDWPRQLCTTLEDEHAESALVDLLDCQTYLFDYTGNPSYLQELEAITKGALATSETAEYAEIHLPCIETSFRFRPTHMKRLRLSLGRACSALAPLASNSIEAHLYVEKAGEFTR